MIPTLRARPEPPFSVRTSRRRGSLSARSATIAAVSSVEPSSTTTYSILPSVWLSTESIACPIQGPTLYAGVTTEINGASFITPPDQSFRPSAGI